MTIELTLLSPLKWVADYSGVAPTLDAGDNVNVLDLAMDSVTKARWRCTDNTLGAPVWVRDDLGNEEGNASSVSTTLEGTLGEGGTVTAEVETSVDTAVVLPFNGGDFLIPVGAAFSFKMHLMALQADFSAGRWDRAGMIANNAGTTGLIGPVVPMNADYSDTNVGNPVISLDADDTGDKLDITVTPEFTTTTKWFATLEFIRLSN